MLELGSYQCSMIRMIHYMRRRGKIVLDVFWNLADNLVDTINLNIKHYSKDLL